MSEDAAGNKGGEPLILTTDGPTDPQFIDDLNAANRLKTFLIGQGTEISPDVLTGLGELLVAFATDLDPRTPPSSG